MENMELDNFYKSKKVLITGNTGFKGSWLSFWLINMGSKVLGYSLKPETKTNLFDTLNLSSKYKTIYGDIRDLQNLKNTIEDFEPDIIFHLAAQSLVKDSYENPVYTFDTNILGTVNLLESVRKFEKIKVVINVTSDKCYANNNLGNDFHENDRLGGVDPYSASKACSEIITEAFFKSFYEKSETRIATARSGNVIGGGDWSKK
jgi:CDP-glucose 4,6-dehydratase